MENAMNEETMIIEVTCENAAVKDKYTQLATKMVDDSDFQSKLNLCSDDESLYQLYKVFGYTDLSFDEFIVLFKDSIKSIICVQPKETFELTQQELESIVGGISFYKYFTALISAIPVSGPFLAGVAKAYTAGKAGNDISGMIRQMMFGRPAVVSIR